ncbi:MAG TPA: hypothetical protein PK031_10870, partial [Pseudomonadales bacterium]|nr:hypothetical protein [Pseudomonadales bacterium]
GSPNNITKVTRFNTAAPHGINVGDVFLVSASVYDNPSNPDFINKTWTARAVGGLYIDLYDYYGSGEYFDASYVITPGNLAKITVSSVTYQAFRTTDVGARVSINGGTAKITSVTSGAAAVATIESVMTSASSAVKNSWAIEYPVWRSGNYPGAVSIFEQRLLFGGSPSFPNSVWLSVIGEYLNFTPGVNDSDSINLSVASDEVADIRHIAQTKALIALSSGSEYTFFGGVEKPITPTNVQVKNQSVYGCSGVRPQRIGNELYFVQRSGRKLRAMAYKFDSDAYGSPDLSVISEHMTESGIVDMAYQQEPESILWLVRADGALVSVTIDRDQDVIAWAKHDVGGFVESIASIPADARDDLYLIVRRTINGETARYVERMNGLATLDCAVFGTSEAGTDTWSGLDHLEGKTVTVIADGALMNPRVVSGGSITIERPAYSVQIGLPFTPELDLLTPEVGTQSGSSAGSAMRACEISLRIHETKGAKINGDYIPFRRFGSGILDVNAEPFSGICRLENLGWEKGDLPISIEGIPGMPLHVLAAIFKYTSNDG